MYPALRTRRPAGRGGAFGLSFADDFARANGALGNGWEYTAGKWTIASGAAVGTPGLDATNLVGNGTFDADSGWTKGSGWDINTTTAGKAYHSGASASGSLANTAGANTAPGSFYRMQFTVSGRTAGIIRGLHNNNDPGPYRNADGAYVQTMRATGTTRVSFDSGQNLQCNLDDVSQYMIVLADMFATRDLGRSDVDVSAALTLTTACRAGLVLCLDSYTNPKYFIIAGHDGTNAMLTKCVNGVYTSLISTAAAYAAGRVLRVVKVGQTVRLYYNGAQVGTDQTVADAGIISNTRHGMMSTAPESNIDNFAAVSP